MNNRQAIALIYLVSSSAISCQATNSISPSHKTTNIHDIQAEQDSPQKECCTCSSESACHDKNTKSEENDMHINAQNVTEEVNNTDTPQNNQPNYEQEADEKEKEIIQDILHNVANIAGNFFNIVAAPNNPQNVGNSIAGMLSGMINIAVQAFKSGELNPYSDQDSIEQFTKKLSNKLKNEMSRLIAIKARLNNCS